MKTALIAGGTGLIGSQLLEILLKDDRYQNVIAIVRKPLPFTHPKLQVIEATVDTLGDFKDQLSASDVFCCLGTTMRQAGSKEAFKKVDYTYPVLLAGLSHAAGAKQFLLVSALGAGKASSIFYNQVKGLTEEAIAETGFESYHIFRPSLLVGPRIEKRAGEDAAKWVYKYLGFLIPQKYQAIESIKVARAMVAYANSGQKGMFVHESAALQTY